MQTISGTHPTLGAVVVPAVTAADLGMRPGRWTTVPGTDRCYSGGYDDGAAAGGVVYDQVRRRGGRWERRSVAASAGHRHARPATAIDAAEGERLYHAAVDEAMDYANRRRRCQIEYPESWPADRVVAEAIHRLTEHARRGGA